MMNNLEHEGFEVKKISFDTLADRIDRGSGRMRLVRTDKIDEVKDIDLSFLRELYNSKDKAKVIYASVLKASILQRRICFLFSRNELHKLVREDQDNRYKSVNAKDYSNFIMHIMGNDILEYLSEENDLKGVASLVRFSNDMIDNFLQLENMDYYQKQINDSSKIYLKKLEFALKSEEKKKNKELKEDSKAEQNFWNKE